MPLRDDRGPGLSSLDIRTSDAARILSAARARNLPVEGNVVTICGTRFVLIE